MLRNLFVSCLTGKRKSSWACCTIQYKSEKPDVSQIPIKGGVDKKVVRPPPQ